MILSQYPLKLPDDDSRYIFGHTTPIVLHHEDVHK